MSDYRQRQYQRCDLLFYRANLPAARNSLSCRKTGMLCESLQSSAYGGGQCPPYNC